MTGQSMWRCRCDCGAEKPEVLYGALVNGKSTSCGCYRSEVMKQRRKPGSSHNTHPDEYRIWLGIKTRCLNTSHPAYRRHGARGIKVCDDWNQSFKAFFRDMGPRPFPEASVERKDNNGHYCPENCVWATRSQQMSNTRRNRNFTWNGKRMCLTAIARLENVRYANLYQYTISNGTPLQEAVETCRSKGFTFLERSVEFGGDNDARITDAKRNRRTQR